MNPTQLCICNHKQSLFYGRCARVEKLHKLLLLPENDDNTEQPKNTHTEISKRPTKKDEEKLIRLIRKNLAKLKATIASSKKHKKRP